MKRLVDAQLPIRLANHLRQMGVEVLHTSELPLRNRLQTLRSNTSPLHKSMSS